ncbi:carbohydrate sulfotransferase 12-like [Engraulis encrasicolus]|uniref:carbohydrate sulfotransferase 12-like n=1 Tax=Engraulis encrasicolus TaxID=184585 RepID=UPI002FD32F89
MTRPRQCCIPLIVGSMSMIFLLAIYWDIMGATDLYLYSTWQPAGDFEKSEPSFQFDMDAFANQLLEDSAEQENGKFLKREWKIHLTPISQKVKQRQEERKETLRSVCSADSMFNFPGKNLKFDDLPDRLLDHLIVDDQHEVIYCFVPKVACTNWKSVMAVLSQRLVDGVAYQNPQDVPGAKIHNLGLHFTFDKFGKRYGSFSRDMMNIKLKKYTKFLFVRDPFVRLISAFRNKFEELNEVFYKMYGVDMLKRYGKYPNPPATHEQALAAGVMNFSHFIQYLLDPETEKLVPYEPHWKQVYRMCHPCQINYDFVGKLETQNEDAEHLLRTLGVDNLVNFPVSNRILTKNTWITDYFANIPHTWRRRLYEVYEADFRLFGYAKPEELLATNKTE